MGGDAEKRILARMRELEEHQSDPTEAMRNGKTPLNSPSQKHHLIGTCIAPAGHLLNGKQQINTLHAPALLSW